MAKRNASRKRLSSTKRCRGNVAALKKWRSSQKKNVDVNVNIDILPSTSSSNQNYSEPADNPDNNYQNNETLIEGNRIINLQHFFTQLRTICKHGTRFACTFANLKLVKEIRKGLVSKFILKCEMCLEEFSLHNQPLDEDTNFNVAAVSGIMSIGGGFYNLEEMLACLNIPVMSSKYYSVCHKKVASKWEETAKDVMVAAAREEAEYARQTRSVDENGVPLVPVVADGCWSKRSYRNNYNALSGAAAIVGQHTGKVLYLGIKNKFCSYCSKGNYELGKDHMCSKNHYGSSTSMESEIIVEGFQSSEKMYGIKYNILIADGDSSTYKKIIESRPYNNVSVEKIECRNHLLRNFTNKLKTLTTNTAYLITDRKLLEKKILRMRSGIKMAIKYRTTEENKVEAALALRNDILNVPYHVFQHHEKCASYFCTRKDEQSELHMISKEFFEKIVNICYNIANHSRSLIYDFDSNVVEQFHSIVAKFVGGKRINYSLSNSYKTRCLGAVVAFNSRCFHSNLRNFYSDKNAKVIRRMEIRRLATIRRQQLLVKKHTTTTKVSNKINNDPDYGENCQKIDLSPEIYKAMEERFLQKLYKTEEEIINIERETIFQASSGRWMEERRNRLTASKFARVCKRRKNTNSASLVYNLLYKSDNIKAPSLEHGKKFEYAAKGYLVTKEHLENVKECGLFIDTEYSFLGASPDGLVGTNKIIEIKCPYAAYRLNLTPEEAIDKKKITFWVTDKEGRTKINKRHDWYYQIQGQLHITKREECVLGVWTGPQRIKVEYISRDDEFWKMYMETELKTFYTKCLLPELVDPRGERAYIRNIIL